MTGAGGMRSPGRIALEWLHAKLLAVWPRYLLTPSEVIMLSTGFIIFVVVFMSIFLPVYVGNGVRAAGYLGTIIPIIYTMFTFHYVFIRTFHRMASSSAFSTGIIDIHDWSVPAERAWTKIAMAFREMKIRERLNKTEEAKKQAITSSGTRNRIGDSGNAKYEDYARIVHQLMRADDVVDLPEKLKTLVDGIPKTYYEKKLLRFLYPPTKEERRERNRRKICYLPLLRMWVWRRTLFHIFAFVVFFLVPLAVFIPVSYKPTSSTRRLEATNRSFGSRGLQDSNFGMYYSSYYALYFFSFFLPFVYLVLLGLEIIWQIVRFSVLHFRRLRERCRKSKTTKAKEAANENTQMVSTTSKPKVLQDPKARNIEVAKNDLIDAIESLEGRWMFRWTSSQTERQKEGHQGQHHAESGTEKAPAADYTINAMEAFQPDNTKPDSSLILVRTLAIAGRILCLRRDFVAHLRKVRSLPDVNLLESYHTRFGMYPDDMAASLQTMEATISKNMSSYREVGRSFNVQHALTVSRMLRTQLALLYRYETPAVVSRRDSYDSLVTGIKNEVADAAPNIASLNISETLSDLEGLLSGLDKRDPSGNEVQFIQALKDIEEALEGAIFELRSSPDEEKTKENQFLCWVGLARIHAVRNLQRGEAMAGILNRMLSEELKRKQFNAAARRLSDHVFVRRCFFWISFTRKARQLEAIRYKLESKGAKRKHGKLNSSSGNQGGAGYRAQVEIIFTQLEMYFLDLVMPEIDPNKPINPAERKLLTFLNKGLQLPRMTPVHGASSYTPPLDCDGDGILTQDEATFVERTLARCQASEILAQLLTLRQQSSNKKRAEVLRKLTEKVDALELRYSPVIIEDESIKYVKSLAKLEDQLAKVSFEWDEQRSPKAFAASGKHQFSQQQLSLREHCFRMGVSFIPDIPSLSTACSKELDELATKSYSGLVLMFVLTRRYTEAGEWAAKLCTKLPAYCLESDAVKLAISEYEKARLVSQLGSFMYKAYCFYSDGKTMLHLFIFWALCVLPLILGANFVLNHRYIPDNARQYNFETDSVFWLRFFGLLLPLLFVLGTALSCTLERRSLWFGEKEAEEEMQAEVANTLSAAAIARKLEIRRRLYEDDSSSLAFAEGKSATIAPKFGGEYPLWSMGEHLVTAPGRRRLQRRGFRLRVTRMAVLVFLFVICPLVVLPPTIVAMTGESRLSRSSPYYFIMLTVVIMYPVATILFFAFKLLTDALPRTVRNVREYIIVYFALSVAFPLCIAVPLLIYGGPNDGVATANLITWLVLSVAGGLIASLRDFVKHYYNVTSWLKRLTWEKGPITKLTTFAYSLSSVFCFGAPPVVFVLVLIEIASPPAARLDEDAQIALAFAIGALEVAACIACAVICTSGVKLGLIHPRLAASSLIPGIYVALGGMIASICCVGVVRRNGNPGNVSANVVELHTTFECAAWATAAQMVILGWGFARYRRDDELRQRFGYFPDDWELIAPTARFVVEEAREVPFLEDAELKRELHERGLEVPLQADPARKDAAKMDRIKAEQMLEDAMKREKEATFEFETKAKRRQAVYEKQLKYQLAETVFSEVVHEPGVATLSDAVTRQTKTTQTKHQNVIRQFRLRKIALPLQLLMNSANRKRIYITQVVKFRPTHLLDVLETEFHVVNILFKVIHAYEFLHMKEIRWVTNDTIAASFSHLPQADILGSVVEITFGFKQALERNRLFVFESPEERDAFVNLIYDLTVKRNPASWTYSGDGLVDRLSKVSGASQSVESAIV